MDAAVRRRRARIRAWRRGMKEVDLLLGPFADDADALADEETLNDFEALLEEADQDIYAWFSGAAPLPAPFAGIAGRIRDFHKH